MSIMFQTLEYYERYQRDYGISIFSNFYFYCKHDLVCIQFPHNAFHIYFKQKNKVLHMYENETKTICVRVLWKSRQKKNETATTNI